MSSGLCRREDLAKRPQAEPWVRTVPFPLPHSATLAGRERQDGGGRAERRRQGSTSVKHVGDVITQTDNELRDYVVQRHKTQ